MSALYLSQARPLSVLMSLPINVMTLTEDYYSGALDR